MPPRCPLEKERCTLHDRPLARPPGGRITWNQQLSTAFHRVTGAVTVRASSSDGKIKKTSYAVHVGNLPKGPRYVALGLPAGLHSVPAHEGSRRYGAALWKLALMQEDEKGCLGRFWRVSKRQKKKETKDSRDTRDTRDTEEREQAQKEQIIIYGSTKSSKRPIHPI